MVDPVTFFPKTGPASLMVGREGAPWWPPWVRSMELTDAYRVLDLPPEVTLEQAETSFRELTQVWHPDRFADEAMKTKAARRQSDLNSAIRRIRQEHARESRGPAHQDPRREHSAGEPPVADPPTRQRGSVRGSASDSQAGRLDGHARTALVCAAILTVVLLCLLWQVTGTSEHSDSSEGIPLYVLMVILYGCPLAAGWFLFFRSASRLATQRRGGAGRFDYALVILALVAPAVLLVAVLNELPHWFWYCLAISVCSLLFGGLYLLLLGMQTVVRWIAKGYRAP